MDPISTTLAQTGVVTVIKMEYTQKEEENLEKDLVYQI